MGFFFFSKKLDKIEALLYFAWKPNHQHFPINKAFIWTFFISAQEEYKNPDFKLHNVILSAIKPSLGQRGCPADTETRSFPGWLFAQHQPLHGEGCVTEGHPDSPSISVQQFFHRAACDLSLCFGKKSPLWNISCCGGSCHLVNAFITIIIF